MPSHHISFFFGDAVSRSGNVTTPTRPLVCPYQPRPPAPSQHLPFGFARLCSASRRTHIAAAAVHPASDRDPSENLSRVRHTFAQPTQPRNPLPNEYPLSQLGVWMSRSMDALEDWMGAGERDTLEMGRMRWSLERLEASRYIFPNRSS
jgi:hypothetical protein